MSDHADKNETVTFKVLVVPRAARSAVIGERDGVLRVRVAAAPVDGAANEELVRTLATALGVKRSSLEIISGARSKTKLIRVTGAVSSEARKLLARK